MNNNTSIKNQVGTFLFGLFFLLPFAAHANLQFNINAGELFFYLILAVILVISQIAYPILTLTYALNEASYSDKKRAKRKIIIGLFSFINVIGALTFIADAGYIYMIPVLIFVLIPLILFSMGIRKSKKTVLMGILAFIYGLNLLLAITGVYDDLIKWRKLSKLRTDKIIYHSNSKKVKIIRDFSNGKLNGPYKKFGFRGDTIIDGAYQMGEPHGYWRVSKYGKLEEEGAYKKGKKEGEWKFYNRNKPQKIETYSNGKLDGLYKEFDYNGTLKLKGAYQMGEKHGYWTTHREGDLEGEGAYKKGKKEGEWKFYDYNNLRRIETYSNGIFDGAYREFDRSEDLIEEGTYSLGLKNGVWKKYRFDRLLTKTTYKYGVKIKEWKQ